MRSHGERRGVTVVATGALALVQDLGRPGFGHLGVPPSGAVDRASLMLANRLVGNDGGAAGIESVLGGLAVRAEASCTVAVTGPSVPVTVDGREVDTHAPVHVAAGSVVRLGSPRVGLRCYLGVSGGLDVPAHLGSRSTDVLSGIGPAPLRVGDLLPLGVAERPPSGEDTVPPRAAADHLVLPVLLGPRDDWFDDPVAQLARLTWAVSPESNRVGVRLLGEPLTRAPQHVGRELTSEPVVTGAVQVPASGRPVIFLADHPTTGGYPVIGVVPDVGDLAQARPGTTVRLRPQAYSDS